MRIKHASDSCTTILVGKKASYDGSTIVARTEDSQNGVFTPKKFVVVEPQDQPRHYQSVLTSFEMDLPDNPVRYTAVPDAVPKDGIWELPELTATMLLSVQRRRLRPTAACWGLILW